MGRGRSIDRLAELIADYGGGRRGNGVENRNAQFSLSAGGNRRDYCGDGGEKHAEEDAPRMARRIDERHRVVLHVAVAVQRLGMGGVGDDRVGLDEAAERGVVVASPVEVEAGGGVGALPGELVRGMVAGPSRTLTEP